MKLHIIQIVAIWLWMVFHVKKTKACSCAPIHPQQKFCQADFVIKATVGKKRMVLIKDDNSVVLLNKLGREVKKEFEENEEEGSGGPDYDGDYRPAPFINPLPFNDRRPEYISEAIGPDSRMPGYLAHFKGINANIGGLRNKRSPRRDRNHSNRRRGRRIKPGSLIKPNTAPIIPFPPIFRYEEIKGRKMIQYTITLLKVFKGEKSFENTGHVFLYTPPPPLCNTNLQTSQHALYLLMGKIRGGRLEIEACDYKSDLTSLNEKERQNLLRNMRLRYKCDDIECGIKICGQGPGPCPPTDPSPNMCYWKEWHKIYHPQASQFACKKVKSQNCKWYNGADPRSTPESFKFF